MASYGILDILCAQRWSKYLDYGKCLYSAYYRWKSAIQIKTICHLLDFMNITSVQVKVALSNFEVFAIKDRARTL